MLNNNRKNNTKISALSKSFAKIYISEKAYLQMSYIIKNSTIEVGWLATVTKNHNDYYIEECILVEQEAHSTTCELKEEALTQLAIKLIENNDIETYDKIKCWCHSHVNMAVYPSSQDDKQMELFKDNDYFIRGIGNKKGELKFDIFDFENNLLIEDVSWEIKRDEAITDRIKELKAELEKLTTIEDILLEEEIKLELKDKVKYKSYANTFKYNKNKETSKTSLNNSKAYISKYEDIESNQHFFNYEDDTKNKKNKKNQCSFYMDEYYSPYYDWTTFDYEELDNNISIFDYFSYEQLCKKYTSFECNSLLMNNWIREQLYGKLEDEQIESCIDELELAFL